MEYRIEKDYLGEKELPKDCLWGIETQRAIENFSISGYKVPESLIKAYGMVKLACAKANYELGFLNKEIAEPIFAACEEMIEGKLTDYIVVDAFQGGAGTSTNMNVNEVLANRALEIMGKEKGSYDIIHPIEHINLHQSTNDTYPTALKIAAIYEIRELEDKIIHLQSTLQEKEQEFANIVKLGRTQLMDAVPLTLGKEFSAWAQAIERDRWRIYKCQERLRVVNIGGTAIGTGITAPQKYIFLVIEVLRNIAGLGLARAENLIEATQNQDVFVEVSGILKAHASSLMKIANDLRLLNSGPDAGISEIILPQVQVGSSIMPGKINPVICEAVNQVAMQCFAADLAITTAVSNGQLELNAFLPLVAYNLLTELKILQNANYIFAEKAIKDIKPNKKKISYNLHHARSTATALVRKLGYEKVSEILKEMEKTGESLRKICLEKNLLTEKEWRKLFHSANVESLGYREEI